MPIYAPGPYRVVLPVWDLQEVFEKADTNKNGTLEAEEMVQLFSNPPLKVGVVRSTRLAAGIYFVLTHRDSCCCRRQQPHVVWRVCNVDSIWRHKLTKNVHYYALLLSLCG